MKSEKIHTQHGENKEWSNSLSFYRDGTKIMESRLAEIVSKNTSKDVLAQAEHFQNQLIIQKDQIDRINHEINISNDTIGKEFKNNHTAIDYRTIPDHAGLRENMKSFETIFIALEVELNQFLSRWM
jgi:hypothetical protein